MKDVELVKGDSEAGDMLLVAVKNVMFEEIETVIQKYARLVPPDLGEQFVDYLYETRFIPDKIVTDNDAGSPNLYGDAAYEDYVRNVMGVTK